MPEGTLRVIHELAPGFVSVSAQNVLVSGPTGGGLVQLLFLNEVLSIDYSEFTIGADGKGTAMAVPNDAHRGSREVLARILISAEQARATGLLMIEAAERTEKALGLKP